MKQTTRSSSKHGVFGNPVKELPLTELPTKKQVGKHFLHLKKNKFKSNKDVVPDISKSLVELWIRSGIPPQPLKSVKTKVLRLMDEGSQASKHRNQSGKSKKFEESLNELFDIANCQCSNFDTCSCEKEKKVPRRERAFLVDQRTSRIMQIGGVDKTVTRMLKRRQERDDRMEQRLNDEQVKKMDRLKVASLAEINVISVADAVDEPDYEEWVEKNTKPEKFQNIISIPNVALAADRHGVSNRATAAICTATLIDYGIITPDDDINVIDKQKVWRARQKVRNDLRSREDEERDHKITGLYFDGKRDMTLVKKKIGNKWYSTKELEDHYVLVGEPGTLYLEHLTLERGTGVAIAKGIFRAMKKLEIFDNIVAVGADSTAVNTGHRNGAIHLLECRLVRNVHWLICYLHLNELPLRHLCIALLGPTKSPTQFEGPVGKALATCESLPLSPVGFKRIADGDPLPTIDFEELSQDQAYLYKIIDAIKTGTIAEDLLRQKPGPMSQARWLTTASRICRLYVATAKPSPELFSITHFIVCNYGPMWFTIKCNSRCTEGAKHILKQIELQRLLPRKVRSITWPIIKRNAYWAHQENVLLAMLSDEDQRTRETAIEIIKTIRRKGSTTTPVREFQIPDLKYTAKSLKDLLPSVAECKWEPPLTKKFSTEELENIAQNRLAVRMPCHSQGVERCVKKVSEASRAVYGVEARDGYIRAVIKSHQLMPSFKSKKDFNIQTVL